MAYYEGEELGRHQEEEEEEEVYHTQQVLQALVDVLGGFLDVGDLLHC